MKKVYPVIFTPDDKWYIVEVPDFDILTQGIGLADAIDIARDTICLMGVNNENEGKSIPEPSTIDSIQLKSGQFA